MQSVISITKKEFQNNNDVQVTREVWALNMMSRSQMVTWTWRLCSYTCSGLFEFVEMKLSNYKKTKCELF